MRHPVETSGTRLWEGLTRAHHVMTAALEKDMLPEAGMPLNTPKPLLMCRLTGSSMSCAAAQKRS